MSGYYAKPCGCDHKSCKHWHVSNVADVQGVAFTKDQAEAVAMLLNLSGTTEGAAKIADFFAGMIAAGLEREANAAIDQLEAEANSRG